MPLDETVASVLRGLRKRPARRSRHSFMKPEDFRRLRVSLGATQTGLAKQMISPDSGTPVTQGIVSRWEKGTIGIPLWAARKIRGLAQAAREMAKA